MRVTERRASPWRHPALAPGYAAVIAFGAVALSGLVLPQREGVTVTVLAADARLLADLTVQVRDQEVCVVSSAAPVRLVGPEPASACSRKSREQISDGRETKLTVEPVQVVAETTDKGVQVPSSSTVTIRDAERVLQRYELDKTGRFTPSKLPLNATVCLDLPTGWRFADSKTTGQQCQSVTNPAADVRFRLEKS